MSFDALEVSLALASSLRRPLAALRAVDRPLHDQIHRALVSIPLNLAEGRERTGRDRNYHWRVAAGSAQEVRAGLRVAIALGMLETKDLTEALALLDRVCAMLYRLRK